MIWGYPSRTKVVVFLGDFALILLSIVISQYFRVVQPEFHASLSRIMAWHASFVPVRFAPVPAIPLLTALYISFTFLASLYVLDLYDVEHYERTGSLVLRLGCSGVGVVLGSSTLFFLLPQYSWDGTRLLNAVFFALSVVFLWRQFFARHGELLVQPSATVIVGTGVMAQQLGALLERGQSGYKLLGFIGAGESGLCAGSILGGIDRLQNVINAHGVRTLVIATNEVPAGVEANLTKLRFGGLAIHDATQFAMEVGEELPLETLSHSWLWFAEGYNLLRFRFLRRVKRLLDLFCATVGLVLSLPLIVPIALAIKLDSPGPVLFRQVRTGWRGQPFTILKFRSMVSNAECAGKAQWAKVNDARVTRVGKWLRKTHLDELPQLLNVFSGDMSFVGPRPERPEFVAQLEQEIPFYDLRHYAVPGVTGWAQVCYPYGASIEDARRKLQYDLYYILRASPVLDIRILLKTVQVVLFTKGSR